MTKRKGGLHFRSVVEQCRSIFGTDIKNVVLKPSISMSVQATFNILHLHMGTSFGGTRGLFLNIRMPSNALSRGETSYGRCSLFSLPTSLGEEKIDRFFLGGVLNGEDNYHLIGQLSRFVRSIISRIKKHCSLGKLYPIRAKSSTTLMVFCRDYHLHSFEFD